MTTEASGAPMSKRDVVSRRRYGVVRTTAADKDFIEQVSAAGNKFDMQPHEIAAVAGVAILTVRAVVVDRRAPSTRRCRGALERFVAEANRATKRSDLRLAEAT